MKIIYYFIFFFIIVSFPNIVLAAQDLSDVSILEYCMITFIPLILILIVIFMWWEEGQDEEIIETVEFYPPEKLNSLELALAYKGDVQSEDVVLLLIDLANQGYIRVEEVNDNNYKFIKLKEYVGNNITEKIFLTGLFNQKNEVMLDELEYNFYLPVESITSIMNNKENRKAIFEKSSIEKTSMIFAFILITFFLAFGKTLLAYIEDDDIVWVVAAIVSILFSLTNLMTITMKWYKLIGLIFMISSMIFAIIYFPVIYSIDDNPVYIFIYLICIAYIIIFLVFVKIMPKRNKKGRILLGKLKGYKNFLETVDKSTLIAHDNYSYEIFSYAYVLGINDIWEKQFADISLKAPDWYIGELPFELKKIEILIKRLAYVATLIPKRER